MRSGGDPKHCESGGNQNDTSNAFVCGCIDLLWPHLGHKYGHTSNNRFETFRLSRSIFDDSNTSTYTFRGQQHPAKHHTSQPSTSTWNGSRQYKCISVMCGTFITATGALTNMSTRTVSTSSWLPRGALTKEDPAGPSSKRWIPT